jgi:hypothetical protein
MAEPTAQPKKHFALDTDRGGAIGMAGAFMLCALFALRALFEIVRNTPPGITVTWHTWLLMGACIFGLFETRDRWFRTICLILALSSATRVLLRVFGATVEMQLANAALLRVIDLMLLVGGCIYIPYWFKSKIRYV